MVQDLIRYDLITQEALRGVIKKVLSDVIAFSNEGELPGEHYFYITFLTGYPGVSLSPRLKEQYPEEMTIVLQHQFWDLKVTDDRFEVGLSFGNIPEKIVIPFDAIKAFFDPHVEFGMQFDVLEAANADEELDDVDIQFENDVNNPVTESASEDNDDEAPVEVAEIKPKKRGRPKKNSKTDADADKSSSGDKNNFDDDSENPDNDLKSAKIVSLDSFRKKK